MFYVLLTIHQLFFLCLFIVLYKLNFNDTVVSGIFVWLSMNMIYWLLFTGYLGVFGLKKFIEIGDLNLFIDKVRMYLNLA